MKLEIPLAVSQPPRAAGRSGTSISDTSISGISIPGTSSSEDPFSHIDEAAALLNVLGQPHRLRIFRLLMRSEYCVCELEDSLRISPTLLAHHLKVLRESGLVRMRRGVTDARWIYYSLEPGAFLALRDALSGLIGAGDLPPEAQCGSSCSCG